MKEQERHGNLFDYLAWRGDLPFSADPFNEADNLILAELAYTDFRGIVPGDGTVIPLRAACESFFSTHSTEAILADSSCTARAPLLMKEMLNGRRFGETGICLFEEERDAGADMQFAAVTFLPGDGTAYTAFRGTDGTVVGWKEDFIFSYLTGTQGQQRAAQYLTRAGERLSLPLRAGGHSKGGNLAVYAAACCRRDIQDRITEVWNNDGPGFTAAFLEEEGYQRILPRVKRIIPDTSVIGMLMESRTAPKVIRSSASGMAQHDALTWQIVRNGFVPAELSDTSRMIRETLTNWLNQTDGNTRKELTETVFSLLESTGAERFSEMSGQKLKSLESILGTIRELPKAKQAELWQTLVRLGRSGRDAASSYLQNLTLDKLLGLRERLPSGGTGKNGKKQEETDNP